MPARSPTQHGSELGTKRSPAGQSASTSERTVAFVSLGCAKNLVDSEKMLGLLAADGIKPVPEEDGADAIVINTCGFLEASKEESLDAVRQAIEAKRQGKFKRVVVAGCLVQRHRAKVLDWVPGIDSLIGVFDRDHIIDAVRGESPGRTQADENAPRYWVAGNALQAAEARGRDTVGLTVNGKDGKGIGYFELDEQRFRLTPRHWAYLRVSEGCNQRCAFCTIPSIRGKMRSKPIDAILSEARSLFRDGAVELNLIGQDTTSYGMDIGYGAGLVGLLRELDKVARSEGGGWLRLMYAYPTNFTEAMMDSIGNLPSVCRYIDIPLQHASDRMLKAMRRGATKASQGQLLKQLQARGIAVRTTFITGFPGETQEDHAELLDFIEQGQFEAMGVFRYSREEGTPAGTMDTDPSLHVPDDIKQAREAELMLLQQDLAFRRSAALATERRQIEVLVDGPAAGRLKGSKTTGVSGKQHLHVGRTQRQAPQVDGLTYISSTCKLAPGEIINCHVVDSDGYDLIAQPADQVAGQVKLPILRSRK